MPSQRHIIAITLQNESGALTRVAGLFSTRGYNIESLNVAATDDPTVSRLTLVTTVFVVLLVGGFVAVKYLF